MKTNGNTRNKIEMRIPDWKADVRIVEELRRRSCGNEK
jgi:hypothetical protein